MTVFSVITAVVVQRKYNFRTFYFYFSHHPKCEVYGTSYNTLVSQKPYYDSFILIAFSSLTSGQNLLSLINFQDYAICES